MSAVVSDRALAWLLPFFSVLWGARQRWRAFWWSFGRGWSGEGR